MISKSPGSRRFETGCTRQVEKAMAPHSSTLAWQIPCMEEPGRLQSMGSQRVGHDLATSLSLFTFMHWRRNGNPLQCSCLENPRDGGAWWAAVYGVAQSWTLLKWLSTAALGWTICLMDSVLCPLIVQPFSCRGCAETSATLCQALSHPYPSLLLWHLGSTWQAGWEGSGSAQQ